MALATAAAIRDRIHELMEAITPTKHSGVKFERVRSEGVGDIVEWGEKNPTACFRRCQARQVGTDDPPGTSSLVEERVMLNAEVRVCYPQSGKFGGDNALDRDDCINADWLKINNAIGGTGAGSRANFTTATAGSYDCTPMPAAMEMEKGRGVDFMVIRLQFEYLRSLT